MDQDKKLVDVLYENILSQNIRSDYFRLTGSYSANSVWNKHTDEKRILDIMVNKYKKYYLDKTVEIRDKLEEIKHHNISSYLTFDVDYYINQYNDRIEEVDKYVVQLEYKTIDDIINDKLSFVSAEIDMLFPNFMATPTLFGKL
jgi:hypothetical protein